MAPVVSITLQLTELLSNADHSLFPPTLIVSKSHCRLGPSVQLGLPFAAWSLQWHRTSLLCGLRGQSWSFPHLVAVDDVVAVLCVHLS